MKAQNGNLQKFYMLCSFNFTQQSHSQNRVCGDYTNSSVRLPSDKSFCS